MSKLPILIAATGALIGSPAIAAPVANWNFDVSLEWVTDAGSEPQFTPGNGTTYYDTVSPSELISWGSSTGDLDPAVNDDRSGLQISESPNSGSMVLNSGIFVPTNQITHFNNTINETFATLDTASLFSALTLMPDDGSGVSFDLDTSFDIFFTETTNTTPCGFDSDSICDDIFVLSGGTLNNEFEYDGFTYFLQIAELSNALTPLSDDACDAAGAPMNCLGFLTVEEEATTAQFGLQITSEPVRIPEPGTMALLGTGLLGLGLITRRRLRG